MPRAALLEHRTPDGNSHFDWLLAPDEGHYTPDDRVLIAFRVSLRIDTAEGLFEFDAQRIADHRWRYLDFEGDLSEDRGSVRRLAEGIWTPALIEGEALAGTIEWGNGSQSRIEGRLIEGDRWVFQNSPPHRR